MEWQLRIAAGEKLSVQQNDIQRNGWAFEYGINTKSPYRNFSPSSARLVRFTSPDMSKYELFARAWVEQQGRRQQGVSV